MNYYRVTVGTTFVFEACEHEEIDALVDAFRSGSTFIAALEVKQIAGNEISHEEEIEMRARQERAAG